MSFFSAINCMDGRVQSPVNSYLKERFRVDYVDVITEPGPDKILSEQTDAVTIESIQRRLDISLQKHHSKGIAIIGHADCAGNPVSENTHHTHIRDAMKWLGRQYPDKLIVGLWVDKNWQVNAL